MSIKLNMVSTARDFVTDANMLDQLDGALPTILVAIIEGRSLYEHGIGEFFLLYGKFEQKYVTQGKNTKVAMEELIRGDDCNLKEYTERGRTENYPLPYAVRNILGHSGHNPNKLDQEGKDLRGSIDLLKKMDL